MAQMPRMPQLTGPTLPSVSSVAMQADVRRTAYPDGVYPPSEDTFLLADALAKDQADHRDPDPDPDPDLVLEIGCGSGFVSATAALLFPRAVVVASDLSWRACAASRETAANHSVAGRVDVICCESAAGIRELVFDAILVNPPYVPTPREELTRALAALRRSRRGGERSDAGLDVGTALTLAWAGGEKGMEVTRCMIRSALARIAGAGAVYILLVKENEPDEVAAFAAEVWRDIVSDAGEDNL